jgi:hypothetical protein
MNKKVKYGLLLTVLLTLSLALIPEQTGHIPMPHKVATKATMEEKRENIRISKRYAYLIHNWRGRESACLVSLWTVESRFDHLAKNKQGSSAFGIAQLLGEKSRDPGEQVIKGLRYIASRHDTPCRALRFHNRHNFY